jgi:hypothetical protein
MSKPEIYGRKASAPDTCRYEVELRGADDAVPTGDADDAVPRGDAQGSTPTGFENQYAFASNAQLGL